MDGRTNKEKEKVNVDEIEEIERIRNCLLEIFKASNKLSSSPKSDSSLVEAIRKITCTLETFQKVDVATALFLFEHEKELIQTRKRISAIESRLGITEEQVNSVRELKTTWEPYMDLLKIALEKRDQYLEKNR